MRSRLLVAIAVAVSAAAAGPVEFGTAELESAIAARGLNPRSLRIKTEVAVEPAESYRIVPGLVTGGDLRGLMYGLLEAAEQIRGTGRLRKSAAAPALAIRGVRMSARDAAAAEWLHSRDYWPALFRALARNRFNRFNLVFANLDHDPDTIRFISQTALDYGVDFTLGLWSDSAVAGEELAGALKELLSACPAIRGVQLRIEPEAAIYVIRALADAGRRLTLDVPADTASIADAASSAGVRVRVSAPFPGSAPSARQGQFFWEVEGAPSASLIQKIAGTGASGLEIEIPAGESLSGAEAETMLRLGRLAYAPPK